jgi:hypothetical protein
MLINASRAIVRLLLQVGGKLCDRGVGVGFVLRRLVIRDVEADLRIPDHPVELRKARVDLLGAGVVLQRRRVFFLLVGLVGLLDLHPRLDLLAGKRGQGESQCRQEAQHLFHRLFNSRSSGYDAETLKRVFRLLTGPPRQWVATIPIDFFTVKLVPNV